MSADSSPVTIRKVVIGNDLWPNAVQSVKDRFPDLDIVLETDSARIDQHLGDADAYTGFSLSREQLEKGRQLKWVHALSAGVEHWINAGIADRDVILTNSSGVHATNIAEHVFAMLLSFARQLPVLQRAQEKKIWRDNDNFREAIFELDGQSMAIVGTGAIGSAVATRAKAFGLRTVGVRRNPESAAPDGIDEQIAFGDLKGRLGDADHVVICLPMTDETAGLFDDELLAAMKPGSHLFNIGRGGIIDQDALIANLHSGHLAGAGLDVTTPEPLPADSPLWDAPNTIITAHTSGNTPKYGERALKLFGDNLEALLSGSEPKNVVDVTAGY